MSNALPPELTDVDRQIIACLRESGRISANEVSRETGLERRQVRRALTHLLDSGTVRVTALADPALLGQPVVAFVWLSSRAVENRFAGLLRDCDEVMWAATTLDKTRAVAQVSCKSSSHLLRLLDRMRAWPGIAETTAAIVLRSYVGPQSASSYQLPRAHSPAGATMWLGGGTPSPLDAIDRQILDLLRVDGRVPLTTIATTADVPITTARRRLSRLLSVEGVRLRCRVSPMALGYRYLAGVNVRVDRQAAEVALAFASLSAASWISEMTGAHSIAVELMTADQDEMDAALAQIVADPRVRDIEVDYYEGNLKDAGRW